MYKPRSVQPVRWQGRLVYLLLVSEYDDWLFAHDRQGILIFDTPAEAVALAQPHLDYWRQHPEPDDEDDNPDDFAQADCLSLDVWRVSAPSLPMTPELALSRLHFWNVSKSLVATLYKTGQLDRYAPRPNAMDNTDTYKALLNVAYPGHLGEGGPHWKGREKVWAAVRQNALELWALALAKR